jgi:MFS family permease
MSAPTAGPTRERARLAVVLAGAFMAVLDVAIVNVGMPAIQADLHTGFGAVALVVSAYTLLYAALLVTGGRLGDLHGRRRVFLTGLGVFTAASALCGFAPTIEVLVAARAVQGVGAALLYPQVLAILQLTLDGERRARALSTFGCVIGVAVIAGQLVGGVLLAWDPLGLSWRPAFLLNVPLGLATLAAGRRLLPTDRRREPRPHLDWGGSALSALTLALLIVPLLLGREAGWPAWTFGALAAVAPTAAWFLAHERAVDARGGTPLLRTALFRDRAFARGVPVAALFSFAYFGFLLLLAVHLQIGLGFSALHAALVYTPAAAGFFTGSQLAPRAARFLGRHTLTAGYLLAAAGLLATAATALAAGAGLAGGELALPLLLVGLGQGLGMTPLIGTVIGSLPPRDAGAGAGVVATTLQLGNAVGVAVLGLLFFAVLGDDTSPAHHATAFATVLPLTAAAFAGAALLVTRLPRRTPEGGGNALLEHPPSHATGFAYSMYLMTGGRVGDRLFHQVLEQVARQRARRAEQAPQAPGAFLAYHFDQAGHDTAWLVYLTREALSCAHRPVPHEKERAAVLRAQVEEIRRRQAEGAIRPDLDPELLRLVGFALANYPRMLPQITRMTTGLDPDDPRFTERWERLLTQLGQSLLP